MDVEMEWADDLYRTLTGEDEPEICSVLTESLGTQVPIPAHANRADYLFSRHQVLCSDP
jgi:hypothetical protein